MSKETYSKKLKSPSWQRKRLEIFNIRGFKCEECGDSESELHVHHRFYIKGRKSWEYDNDVFQVLCCNCHEKEHDKQSYVTLEKYKDIISIIEKLNDLGNDHIEPTKKFLEYVLAECTKDDETYYLEEIVEALACSKFGDVIKYMIKDYSHRERNESDLLDTIRDFRDEIKSLKKVIYGTA